MLLDKPVRVLTAGSLRIVVTMYAPPRALMNMVTDCYATTCRCEDTVLSSGWLMLSSDQVVMGQAFFSGRFVPQ